MAIATPFRKWEFVKCLFSLNEAPAYFLALIKKVLEGCEAFAIADMDDILIFSKDEETHVKHLRLYL